MFRELLKISDLPAPPAGRTGWPWTDASPLLSERMPDGQLWPRISIVTPSYNQGRFIEETIRSVLLQGYPNLEYIIIDGGSTDESVEVIRKYEPWLAHWVSENDKGQSHAINKGFSLATGEIFNWLNSDDTLLGGALLGVGTHFDNNKNTDLVFGNRILINAESVREGIFLAPIMIIRGMWGRTMVLPQETCFWRRSLHTQLGGLDEDYKTIMDQEFFLRAWEHGNFKNTLRFIGAYRSHPETISSNLINLREQELIRMRAKNGFRISNKSEIFFDTMCYRITQLYALASGVARVRRIRGSWKWDINRDI